jgi:hypothetical protein
MSQRILAKFPSIRLYECPLSGRKVKPVATFCNFSSRTRQFVRTHSAWPALCLRAGYLEQWVRQFSHRVVVTELCNAEQEKKDILTNIGTKKKSRPAKS